MAQPAHSLQVKVGGTAVAVTGEACAAVGVSTTVFQVTNTAKRVIDPATLVVVKVDGVAVPNGGNYYKVDYLFGVITFFSAPGGVITADFSYLPLVTVAEARKVNVVRKRDLLDKTSFDSAGVRRRLAGLMDFEGSIEGLALASDDLESGVGGVQSILGFFNAGTPKLLAVQPATGTIGFRGWFLFENVDESASFDGLFETTLPIKGTTYQNVLTPQYAADPSIPSHGWGTTG